MPAPLPLLIALAALGAPGGVEAAADANASAAALSSAEEITAAALAQIKGQDKLIQQLKTTSEQQQAQVMALQARLAAAESATAWLPWLVLALALSGAVAIWLGLRAQRLQRQLSQARWSEGDSRSRASSGLEHGGAGRAGLSSGLDDRTLASHATGIVSSSAPVGLAPMVAPQRAVAAEATLATTRALSSPMAPMVPAEPSAFSLGTGVPPREVSVEELLDLEQQVDFFVVLGQEEAAIDLLVSHIRANGGSSPLPYLKLMEIFGQRGDEQGYERTRSRFNLRFSAQAPAFGGDLYGGRALEDYAEVVERLQVLWPLPTDAVAETERLMQPQDGGDVFDLPAFRDLVLLHGMAEDLAGRPSGSHETTQALKGAAEAFPASLSSPMTVDLLLPLDSYDNGDTTSPQPWLTSKPLDLPPLASWSAAESSWPDDRRRGGVDSSRIDLDLNDLAPAPREFTRPAAFTDVDLHRDSRRSDFAALDDGPDPTRPARPR